MKQKNQQPYLSGLFNHIREQQRAAGIIPQPLHSEAAIAQTQLPDAWSAAPTLFQQQQAKQKH